MRPALVAMVLVLLAMVPAGCSSPEVGRRDATITPPLAGAWRSTVRFKDGAFASVADLEFMYVFNAGGTMTESSNYDGAPPVPPAYGAWRAVGPGEFEAKYEFYATRPPASLADLTRGGGWLPAGRGVFVERIRISAAGDSFSSRIRYDAFDAAGRPIPGGGVAEGRAARIGF